MLHAWHAHGHEDADREYRRQFGGTSPLSLVLRGKLAFLKQVRGADDRIFRRLYGWARDLDDQLFAELPPLAGAVSLEVAAAEYPAISESDPRDLRRQYLARMFTSAEGTLWVIDPNLTIAPLRVLVDSLRDVRVSEVRFLSRDSLDGNRLAEYQESVIRFRREGKRLEWRSSGSRLFHDRWLVDDAVCVSIGGPFNNITDTPNPPYGQNIVTRRPEQLDEWWRRSSAL